VFIVTNGHSRNIRQNRLSNLARGMLVFYKKGFGECVHFGEFCQNAWRMSASPNLFLFFDRFVLAGLAKFSTFAELAKP
jgi:hypothetical protein